MRFFPSRSARLLRPLTVSLTVVAVAAAGGAAEIELSAPREVGAASEVVVGWTGTLADRDFVSIDPVGAPEREYSAGYAYASAGSPVTLRAPGEPGDYEIRFHSREPGYAILASAPLRVVPVSATLQVEDTVERGGVVKVTWSGPDNKGDFLSIDAEGAAESAYGLYAYTSQGSPVEIPAPGEEGRYEVRYHLGSNGYAVIGSSPLVVGGVSATLEALASVEAGGVVVVTWSGPDNRGDFLSIDAEGAAESAYGLYAYTSQGSPVEIPAPGEEGRYEIRYHLGASGYPVIGSVPLTVGGVSASVAAPARVGAGGVFSVTWSGPDNQGDFLSIDEPGSADSSYGRYAYSSEGSPVELQAPDEPGSFVVRYHLGASGYPVIGSAAIAVEAVTASVDPSSPIVAGEPFEVAWTGPDNPGDFVTIVPAGAALGEYGNFGYTRRGTPLRVEAPREVGAFEVRYLTGQSRRQLASVAVDVLPGAARGSLRVLSGASAQTGGQGAGGVGAVEVILDASGSMLQRLDGERRIDLARAALLDLTGETLPAGVPFVLRVFGHREADSCRTDLEIPLGPLERGRAAATLRSVEAKNLAKTPIADSLRRAREDLAAASGPRLIVLVTDGEETCNGDPAEAIGELRGAGYDVRVNIVGFAIDELMLKEEFERWARLGGGRYFDASDGEALQAAVRGAVRPSFEVLDGDNVVASGAVDGDAVELPPGEYRVRTTDGRELGAVTVRPDQEATLRIEG